MNVAGTITAVSGWTTEGRFSNLGTRYPLEGSLSGVILETGRPARIDNYAHAPGEAQEAARQMGSHSAVGGPITVDGRLWGVLAAASKSEQPLPRDTERRLAEFAEPFATAIANAENRAELDASRARIVATAGATRRRSNATCTTARSRSRSRCARRRRRFPRSSSSTEASWTVS
jgi:GAF domain-containing protein